MRLFKCGRGEQSKEEVKLKKTFAELFEEFLQTASDDNNWTEKVHHGPFLYDLEKEKYIYARNGVSFAEDLYFCSLLLNCVLENQGEMVWNLRKVINGNAVLIPKKDYILRK